MHVLEKSYNCIKQRLLFLEMNWRACTTTARSELAKHKKNEIYFLSGSQMLTMFKYITISFGNTKLQKYETKQGKSLFFSIRSSICFIFSSMRT